MNDRFNNILVIQSGGPTSAINATLAGIIEKTYRESCINTIYGSINGITGLIHNNLIELKNLTKEQIEKIKHTPGTLLGSARYVLDSEFRQGSNVNDDYKSIIQNVMDKHIGGILVIGGNDSMDTVDKLSKAFNALNVPCDVIGVPKTIDNDLVSTDHTPGYGSAAKYIAATISEIKIDTSAYANGRVTIVEIMGRDAGWLAASSKLSSLSGLGPDLIYLPESPFDMNDFLRDVKNIYDKNKKCLVCVSEGIRGEDGKYVSETYSYNNILDVFGHKQLGGISTVLADVVFNELKIPVRHIELNLMQRCDIIHASKTDLEEAYKAGQYAVKLAKIGFNGCFVSLRRNNEGEYKIKYCPEMASEVANKVRQFPSEWIIGGNDISKEYIDYALPLIQGEVKIEYENGIPQFANLSSLVDTE